MFWELIAALCAGAGAAGLGLMARRLSKGRTPAWLVPALAGVAMLSTQIANEYSWFAHQKRLLPQNVDVVTKVESRVVWRPWSYLWPQVARFSAVRVGEHAVNQENPALVMAEVYLFERWQPVRRVYQVYHCRKRARADFHGNLETPEPGAPLNDQWVRLSADDPRLAAVCGAGKVVKGQ